MVTAAAAEVEEEEVATAEVVAEEVIFNDMTSLESGS